VANPVLWDQAVQQVPALLVFKRGLLKMTDVLQILTAFGTGLLSFFSPCVLPLIPAYICFITGLSAEELSAPKEKDFNK